MLNEDDLKELLLDDVFQKASFGYHMQLAAKRWIEVLFPGIPNLCVEIQKGGSLEVSWDDGVHERAEVEERLKSVKESFGVAEEIGEALHEWRGRTTIKGKS